MACLVIILSTLILVSGVCGCFSFWKELLVAIHFSLPNQLFPYFNFLLAVELKGLALVFNLFSTYMPFVSRISQGIPYDHIDLLLLLLFCRQHSLRGTSNAIPEGRQTGAPTSNHTDYPWTMVRTQTEVFLSLQWRVWTYCFGAFRCCFKGLNSPNMKFYNGCRDGTLQAMDMVSG